MPNMLERMDSIVLQALAEDPKALRKLTEDAIKRVRVSEVEFRRLLQLWLDHKCQTK